MKDTKIFRVTNELDGPEPGPPGSLRNALSFANVLMNPFKADIYT